MLTRPFGLPRGNPQVFFAIFSYQAQSWGRPRRVVAKVELHQGELYPRVGFIVTNLTRPAQRVSKFYNVSFATFQGDGLKALLEPLQSQGGNRPRKRSTGLLGPFRAISGGRGAEQLQ